MAFQSAGLQASLFKDGTDGGHLDHAVARLEKMFFDQSRDAPGPILPFGPERRIHIDEWSEGDELVSLGFRTRLLHEGRDAGHDVRHHSRLVGGRIQVEHDAITHFDHLRPDVHMPGRLDH